MRSFRRPRAPGTKGPDTGLHRRSETTQQRQTDEVHDFGSAGDPDGRPKVIDPQIITEQTRSWLAKFLLVAVTVAMLMALGISIWTSDWRYVVAVWPAASLIVLPIVRHYFRQRKNE